MFPEEQELGRLDEQQKKLEEQLASAELALETAATETERFKQRYYRAVGALYAELDELDARADTGHHNARDARTHTPVLRRRRDRQRGGVTGETVPALVVRGLILRDRRGRLVLTDAGRAAQRTLRRGCGVEATKRRSC